MATRTKASAANGAAASNGYLDVEELLTNAPRDLVERDVEAFGGKVKIRSLTAAQSMKVENAGIRMDPNTRRVQMTVVDAIVMKFQLGVVIPEMDHNQVMRAFQNSGPSFMKVIQAIDEISGTGESELTKAAATFPGPEEA